MQFNWGNLIDSFYVYTRQPKGDILVWPKRQTYNRDTDGPDRRLKRNEDRTRVIGRVLQVEDLTQLSKLPKSHFDSALTSIVPFKLVVIRYHTNFKHELGQVKEGAFIEGQQTLQNLLDQLKQLEYVHEETYGPITTVWQEPSVLEDVLVLCVKFLGHPLTDRPRGNNKQDHHVSRSSDHFPQTEVELSEEDNSDYNAIFNSSKNPLYSKFVKAEE